MLHTSRLNRDRETEESVARLMREAVAEYTAAVDQDMADGLDPEVAREWKERAQEIANLANLDMAAAGTGGGEPLTAPRERATDNLAPLREAIEKARLTASTTNRELSDPEETVLRGLGKQLGSSRKEIMALSRNLIVGQPAGVAAEATRLADEACENIRVSRELVRAALRDMGAASDISEVSGPVRAQPAAQGVPPTGQRPAVPMPGGPQRPPLREWDRRPPLREWEQRPPPPRLGAASSPCEVGRRGHAGRLGTAIHTNQPTVGVTGVAAAAEDRRGEQRTDYHHEERDECPGQR
jgi:hypothetical protein